MFIAGGLSACKLCPDLGQRTNAPEAADGCVDCTPGRHHDLQLSLPLLMLFMDLLIPSGQEVTCKSSASSGTPPHTPQTLPDLAFCRAFPAKKQMGQTSKICFALGKCTENEFSKLGEGRGSEIGR